MEPQSRTLTSVILEKTDTNRPSLPQEVLTNHYFFDHSGITVKAADGTSFHMPIKGTIVSLENSDRTWSRDKSKGKNDPSLFQNTWGESVIDQSLSNIITEQGVINDANDIMVLKTSVSFPLLFCFSTADQKKRCGSYCAISITHYSKKKKTTIQGNSILVLKREFLPEDETRISTPWHLAMIMRDEYYDPTSPSAASRNVSLQQSQSQQPVQATVFYRTYFTVLLRIFGIHRVLSSSSSSSSSSLSSSSPSSLLTTSHSQVLAMRIVQARPTAAIKAAEQALAELMNKKVDDEGDVTGVEGAEDLKAIIKDKAERNILCKFWFDFNIVLFMFMVLGFRTLTFFLINGSDGFWRWQDCGVRPGQDDGGIAGASVLAGEVSCCYW